MGGVHPPEVKISRHYRIESISAGEVVQLPLLQHTGKVAIPIVKEGDVVLTGQKIAKEDGFISSPVHSSVSGKVKEIKDLVHPTLGVKVPTIVIENDGKNKTIDFVSKYKEYFRFDKKEIIDFIKDNGIVGLGGAMFPTHVKLSPKKEVDVVLLNGCECEPYLTCDERLMQECSREILEGLKIIMYLLDAVKGIVVIEDNKPQTISKMKEVVSKVANVDVAVVKTKYPQGAEKQLIKTVLGKEVPSGGLPLDVGVVVQNIATSLAIYNAVVKGIPLYERVITVSGDVNRIGNFMVKVGTIIKDIVKVLNINITGIDKIVFGGPMMGVAVNTLESPMLKGTSGILFLRDSIKSYSYGPCIRCGKCVSVCPMKLMPNFLSVYIENEMWDRVKIFSPNDCIECGCCSYVCVSNRPIVAQVKYAKSFLREKKI